MLRRRFLQLVALSSAGVLAPLDAMEEATARSVTFRVKGFSCPTCGVGLDTMLCQKKGIISSKSTYPEGKVRVSFNSDKITESAVEAFIADMGFIVEGEYSA